MPHLGQKGIAHILLLILLLGGLAAGLFLVQKAQIFKPKAGSKPAEVQVRSWKDDSGKDCRTYEEGGELKTTCPEVKLKILSPQEIGGSSDGGFQVIKNAYADDNSETRECKTAGLIGTQYVRSSKGRIAENCWPFSQVCRNYQLPDGRAWARCVPNGTPECNNGELISDARGRFTCKANQTTLEGPNPVEGPLFPFPKEEEPSPTPSPTPTLFRAPSVTPVPTRVPAGELAPPESQNCSDNVNCGYDGQCSSAAEVACPPAQGGTGTAPNAGTGGSANNQSTPTGPTKIYFSLAESQGELGSIDRPEYRRIKYTPGKEITYKFKPAVGGSSFKKAIYIQFSDEKGQIIKVGAADFFVTPVVEYVVAPSPTPTPSASPSPSPTKAAGAGGCPDPSQAGNYPSEKLMDLCKDNLKQLARLDLKYLYKFDNDNLVKIGRATGNLGAFLSEFSGDRLVGVNQYAGQGFSIDILKELPCSSIINLPGYVQNQITAANGGVGCSATLTSRSSDQTARCTSLQVVSVSATYTSLKTNYSGTAGSLKLWIASNSEVGKDGVNVTSWSPVQTDTNPQSGKTVSFNTPSDIAAGKHAILMELFDSSGTKTDGNTGVVNAACTTTADY